ncbi:MAG TPA: ABC transporter substrate-binding protein [Methylomirabilota bacterium]|nr:ABC transporter substrate-binding protein [Methylomirabilota bacterium]
MRARRPVATVGLVLVVLLAFRGAEAQEAGKVYRIGVLETTGAALNAANLNAFRTGLKELGYVEGRNLVIEYRSADGRSERFPALATQLVRSKVDLILTRGTPAVIAAKNATPTIPIVMAASGDPLSTGVVTGLARPGGNVTGLSALTAELGGKRLHLLKEAVPVLRRVAALLDMENPTLAIQWQAIEAAALSMDVRPQLLDVRKAEHFGPAFDAAIKERADAVIVSLSTLTQSNVGLVTDLAARRRLPSVYSSREFVDAGGLMAYGVSYPDLYRRAAKYVAKIFQGAKAADLPIEQPTKFELAINMKAAKALGLTIPPSLLLQADHVVE